MKTFRFLPFSGKTGARRPAVKARTGYDAVPTDRHLLILGHRASGKTTLIRDLIARGHYGRRTAFHVVAERPAEYEDLRNSLRAATYGRQEFEGVVNAAYRKARARAVQQGREFGAFVLFVDSPMISGAAFGDGGLPPVSPETRKQVQYLLRMGRQVNVYLAFTVHRLTGIFRVAADNSAIVQMAVPGSRREGFRVVTRQSLAGDIPPVA